MKLQPKDSKILQPHPPLGAKPKTRIKLDPSRALEPARKKLSTLEAQRIMAVLVETIKRTELVTALPDYILTNLDRFRVMLGSDLVHLLEDHRVMIQSFEELKAEAERLLQKEQAQSPVSDDDNDDIEEEEADVETDLDQSRNTLDDTVGTESPRPESVSNISIQADAAMRNLGLVATQIQQSCKNILRGFSINQSALTSILQDYEDRSDPAQDMISEMNELKDILLGMLLTTPVEEAERNLYLREVSERERYNAGIIAKLEAELSAANEDKDTEVRNSQWFAIISLFFTRQAYF